MTIYLNLHLQRMKIHFLKSLRGMKKDQTQKKSLYGLLGINVP